MDYNWKLNTAMNRLIGYCESAGFILETSQDGKTVSVHKDWFNGLLRYKDELLQEMEN